MASNSSDASLLQRCAWVVRRIIGAPDYQTYLEHMALRNPDQTPMSSKEFERQRLEERYSRPGSRCC